MNKLPDNENDDLFMNSRIRLLMKLRNLGITDTKIIAAIEGVPREKFVPRMFRDKAYADDALPIESGQTISQPSVVACMTAALELEGRERVLEIGTGSGYQAAVLSKLVRRVYSIERYKSLLDIANERFAELGITNITAMIGDGTKGWAETAPFDRIIVTAAAEEIPDLLLKQLAIGGIMIIPIGNLTGEQNLVKITKTSESDCEQEELLKVRFVPLIEGKPPE